MDELMTGLKQDNGEYSEEGKNGCGPICSDDC